MPHIILGKKELGEGGFCQDISKISLEAYQRAICVMEEQVPEGKTLLGTSITSNSIVQATGGKYYPQMRLYTPDIHSIFKLSEIYKYFFEGKDAFRPGTDIAIWDSLKYPNLAFCTFASVAPIITIECENGYKAIGVLRRDSLMAHGLDVFSNIFSLMREGHPFDITVTLVTCTNYQYHGGTIPATIKKMIHASSSDNLRFSYCFNPNKEENLFGYGENGNHVVILF